MKDLAQKDLGLVLLYYDLVKNVKTEVTRLIVIDGFTYVISMSSREDMFILNVRQSFLKLMVTRIIFLRFR
jgi:hypothetical protein